MTLIVGQLSPLLPTEKVNLSPSEAFLWNVFCLLIYSKKVFCKSPYKADQKSSSLSINCSSYLSIQSESFTINKLFSINLWNIESAVFSNG